ncbi:MAG TPA: GMC oxidoreductase [Solirubrobacteraceae bacterium]|nr:GMC oxidoreductase [Solirubrobacteraceae bacterium]
MEHAYDAVVVGSGFGGGIASCRLAEAGARVCVLERGRRFGAGDYPDRPSQAPFAFWHPDLNPGGMFDLRLMRDLSVLTAAGVGGGSLVYANVQLRAPPEVFDDAHWPAAIDRAALDPWYDRTEDALQPRTTPLEPDLPKVRAFAAMGDHAGREAERLPLAVHFGEARAHPFSGVHQQGCDNLGRCDVGCPLMAKNTVDITYIARAEAHGAEVYPLHEVTRVEPPQRTGGNWRVWFRDLQYRVDGEVEAPLVVLAAGTLGSTRLLLRGRRRLERLSPALGTRFSGNGDALALAVDPRASDVAGARTDFGPSMTSRLVYGDRGFMVADGGLPTSFGGLLEIVRGLNALTGWGRVVLHVKNAAAKVGLTDRPVTHRDVRLKDHRAIGDTLVFLMIGRDAASGVMRLTPLFGRLDIRWSKADSAELFDGMRAAAGELAQAAQGGSFFALDAGPLGKFITVHPLGGCPMADDPRAGVVDDGGKVHGYDGLYVLDGSIVPTALGVNPSKTIAALAERGADRLVAERSR